MARSHTSTFRTPAPAPEPRFGGGDRVGWSVELNLEPGEGIVTAVLPPDATRTEYHYLVAVYCGGRYSGHQIPLPDAVLYEIPDFDPASQTFDPTRAKPPQPVREAVIRLQSGAAAIHYPQPPEPCDYVRLVGSDGREIGHWRADEWRDAPRDVMGEILGAAQHPDAG